MATRYDVGWRHDDELRKCLNEYVNQNLKRSEILPIVKQNYSQYSWSIRSLDRRLRYFNIYYIDKCVDIERIKTAVQSELDGPGNLLGYRAMHLKVRQYHEMNVPRDLIHAVMFDLDPEGLAGREPNSKKRKKGNFTSKGPNFVHSLDGHDKLMGYQNSTFPLAIYGCIDTASRKLLWIKVWTSNSNPKLVGRWYFDYVYETKTVPSLIRVDKGTETGIMSTIHAFLRQQGDMDPSETVLYGPSTSNQIERWWKELHERLEKFFKIQLNYLKDHGYYNPHSKEDRLLLAFLLIPILEKELEAFKIIWNSHRIRKQKNTLLPDGVPNHIFGCPSEYNMENCGLQVTEEQLEEVAELSGVLDVPIDFLETNFREKCERIIPFPVEVKPQDCQNAFIYLKEKFQDIDSH